MNIFVVATTYETRPPVAFHPNASNMYTALRVVVAKDSQMAEATVREGIHADSSTAKILNQGTHSAAELFGRLKLTVKTPPDPDVEDLRMALVVMRKWMGRHAWPSTEKESEDMIYVDEVMRRLNVGEEKQDG